MKMTNEVKIGILVVAVLAILAVLTWNAGEFKVSPQGYEVKVHFKNIEGIEKNAPVTLNGLEVGRVKDLRIIYGEETIVELTLWLDASARLHEGASAFVKNMGFLGEKYVGLTTGEDGKGFLAPGSIIFGKEPTTIDELLKEGQEIAKNVKDISANVNERLRINSENIDAIFADLRVTMGNLASISTNVNERLQVNKLLIDDTVVHLNGASKNLEEMSQDLKINPWKLMYKPKKK